MTDRVCTNPHNPQTDPDDITETRPAATRHALVDPQPPGVAPWDTREADQ